VESLWGWNNTIHLLEEKELADAHMFLLRLDPIKRTLEVKSFRKAELETAQRAYEQAEKETENDATTQVVLVAVEDLDALRRAYPNYYVDTTGFLAAVEAEIGPSRRQTAQQAEAEYERQQVDQQSNLFDGADQD